MEDVREFKVTADSLRKTRRGRKQAGGSAPLDQIGAVTKVMTDAMTHASAAYGQTLQGTTPMLSSGTLTSQIIRPIETGPINGIGPESIKADISLAQTPMAGGKQRVELKAPHHKTRVALRAPRKLHRPATSSIKTHKVRKIGLALKGLARKLKKARKTAKKAAIMSIDVIKSSLVKSGLLKGGSKAPEELMRKMYADLKTTSSGL